MSTIHPQILLTNDDGFSAIGIAALYRELVSQYDVVVSAPQSEQSGIGHAFTFNKPISYHALSPECGMKGWAVSGTPSDCVKMAVGHLMPNMPDIVVSGMNIGENSGISSFYSGTVAGAREGAFWRLPSIAFSISGDSVLYLEDYCKKALELLGKIMSLKQTSHSNVVFYNVNFPDCSPADCKGIKVTRQSLAYFDDKYKTVTMQNAEEGFQVYGEKKDVEPHDSFDSRALMNNYITITPLCFDATAEWAIPFLSGLEQNENT